MRVLLLCRRALELSANALAKVPSGRLILFHCSVSLRGFSPTHARRIIDRRKSLTHNLIDEAADVLFQPIVDNASVRARQIIVGKKDPTLRHTVALAEMLLRSARIAAAYELLSQEAEQYPQNADVQFALGMVLKHADDKGTVKDPVVGLRRGPVPRTEEALKAFEKARAIERESPAVLYEVGVLTFQHRDAEDGLRILRQAIAKAPHPVWLRQLGSYYRQPHVADFENALLCYERAFEADPRDHRSLAGIVSVGTRWHMDWRRLWGNARRLKGSPRWHAGLERVWHSIGEIESGSPGEGTLSPALAAFSSAEVVKPLTKQVAELVILRLQFAGRFREGFELRQQLARQVSDQLRGLRLDRAHRFRRVLAAQVYTEDFEEAAKTLVLPFGHSSDNHSVIQREKLSADFQLLRGNMAPLLNFSAEQRNREPLAGDDYMERLVRGKRVAIVGPADSGAGMGDIIDSYDVVIRTRFKPEIPAANGEQLGRRTDIAYLNGLDLRQFGTEIENNAREGTLKLVVARQLSYATRFRGEAKWLRYSRNEFSLNFHGVPLAIPRIIYDVMQFEPAEIGLFNVDMYSGSSSFVEGYRPGENGLRPGSALNDVIVVHDLLADFRFLQGAYATGVIAAMGPVEDLLNLTSGGYLERLEKQGSLRLDPNYKVGTVSG